MARWVSEDFFKKWCVGAQPGVSLACLRRDEAFKKWLHRQGILTLLHSHSLRRAQQRAHNTQAAVVLVASDTLCGHCQITINEQNQQQKDKKQIVTVCLVGNRNGNIYIYILYIYIYYIYIYTYILYNHNKLYRYRKMNIHTRGDSRGL